jgi:hypothetical protein
MTTFNPGTYQSGDGNLNEPILVGRLGQPLKLGGGPEFTSHGSGPIENRPSAVDFGPGTWQDGSDTYSCNGINWSLNGNAIRNVQTIALIGDSINAYGTTNTTDKHYNQVGIVSCAMSYAGWIFEYQPSDNFAVPNYTTAQTIAIQLPLLLAAHQTRKYSRCFISVLTNDTDTVPVMKANIMSLFTSLRDVGITPVHFGVLPRGNDSTVSVQKNRFHAMNDWLYELSLTGFIEFIDITEAFADTSSIYGNSAANMTLADRTHPNNFGGILAGKIIADYYVSRGYTNKIRFATQQNDLYDINDNPHGVAFLNANPLMIGGTTAPTGMTTSGGTWSKVTRTLTNGQTRSDPTVALLIDNTQFSLYDDRARAGGWNATDIQPGDVIEGRAKVVIVGGAAITKCYLVMAESDGATTVNYHCNNPTSPAGPSDVSGLPAGDHTLYFKTPRLTVRPYSGSGTALVYLSAILNTGVGAAGSFTVQSFEIRKVG